MNSLTLLKKTALVIALFLAASDLQNANAAPKRATCSVARPIVSAVWARVYKEQFIEPEAPRIPGMGWILEAHRWEGLVPSEELARLASLTRPASFHRCIGPVGIFSDAFRRQAEYILTPPKELIDGGSRIKVSLPIVDKAGQSALISVTTGGPYLAGHWTLFHVVRGEAGEWRIAGVMVLYIT